MLPIEIRSSVITSDVNAASSTKIANVAMSATPIMRKGRKASNAPMLSDNILLMQGA